MEKQKFSPTLFDRMTAQMNIGTSPAAWLSQTLKEKPGIKLICITHKDSVALPNLFTLPGGTEAWIPADALPTLKHIGVTVVDRKLPGEIQDKDAGAPPAGGQGAGGPGPGAEGGDQDNDEEQGGDGKTMSSDLQKLVDTIIDAEAAKIIYDEQQFPNKLIKEYARLLEIKFGWTDPVKKIREQVFAVAVAKFN
jgi:hypothetical protein